MAGLFPEHPTTPSPSPPQPATPRHQPPSSPHIAGGANTSPGATPTANATSSPFKGNSMTDAACVAAATATAATSDQGQCPQGMWSVALRSAAAQALGGALDHLQHSMVQAAEHALGEWRNNQWVEVWYVCDRRASMIMLRNTMHQHRLCPGAVNPDFALTFVHQIRLEASLCQIWVLHTPQVHSPVPCCSLM